MYIKIIGSLFLVISSGLIGFLKADELRERVKRLQEFKRMIVLLQGELRFHRAALPEAFERVSERVEQPFSWFLKDMSKQLEIKDPGGFEMVWENASERLLLCEGFERNDGQLLAMLQKSLGYLDLTMQTENLNMVILHVEDEMKAAREQQAVKGKLYQTMGVTTGALLTLLMI